MATRNSRITDKLWARKKGPNFKIGKIPPKILERTVYRYAGTKNPRVLFGSGIGIDAAGVKYPDRIVVFKTDPITGTTSNIGSHSVYVNANDIATTGAKPVWYLATLFLPLGSKETDLKQIMQDIDSACTKLGISLIGGHCEVTPGITRPIIAGFMIGESKNEPLTSKNAQVGDTILMTKTAGIEGTAILASDYYEDLRQLSPETIDRARKFSKQISIVKEALTIAGRPGIHALHDPTEGGLLNGLWELAQASGHGIEVYVNQIPVAEETKLICDRLQLDPLRLMSSGSLLIAILPSCVSTIQMVLRRLNIKVNKVGTIIPLKKGRSILKNNRKKPLGPIIQDELYKLA